MRRWTIVYLASVRKDIRRIDPVVRPRIRSFLEERVASLEDPRSLGEALKGSELGAFWKYRVGDYRIICSLEDAVLTVLVVRIGNRRDVYR
ncbi:MAG: Plasmid stabilization system protein [Acidobacteria bacterium ADurb.Bin340]|jgi:mRNA interferase RelE/StbE|nr:MAG: Plasmid stabilization system protein [Acidobacteria bacterium ADurb.Bin340]HQL48254.1 type II toxin-antitoxin system RelE/ParE family toxin [Holophaga sp.]